MLSLIKIKYQLILFIPNNLNYLIGEFFINLKNNKLQKKTINYLYIYNTSFNFILYLNSCNYSINLTSSTIVVYSRTLLYINYMYHVQTFFKSLSYYFIKKIKFNGKSYRIEKNINTKQTFFELKFGHAINSYIFLKNIKHQQIKKSKMYFWFTDVKKINQLLRIIISVRFWNSYTQRGLRLNKQLIYKRQGKKSTYV